MSDYYKKSTVQAIANYFEKQGNKPLAAKLRPKNLDNILLCRVLCDNGVNLKVNEWDEVREVIRRSEDKI